MTGLPSMPLFVDDYEAAAAHLSLEEDGAYNRLLRLAWRMPDCALPDDPAWIARRLRIDAATYRRLVAPLIDEFFSREGGRIFQKRQVREFRYVTDLVAKRRAAGKRGGDAKARRRKSEIRSQKSEDGDGAGKPTPMPEHLADDRAAPRPTATPAPTGPPLLREAGDHPPAGKTRALQRRGKRLPEDWTPSTKDRDFALKEGLDHAEIERTADRFRDYWTARAGPSAIKRDWAATWRNWVRGDADRREEGNGDAGTAAARPPGRKRGPHRARDRPGVGSVTEAAFRVLAEGGDDPDLSG
ncbi:MAG: DUF1376 domain-containing protein [Pseudomonadota bacterium]